MVHYILLIAAFSGGEWTVQQSDYIFRKQELCQVVGETLKQKHDAIQHYRCVERTQV